MNCRELVLLSVERGLRQIGIRAFAGCDKLPQAILPYGLESIGRMAFYGCRSLSFARMPSNTKVDVFAFEGCAQDIRVLGGVSVTGVS